MSPTAHPRLPGEIFADKGFGDIDEVWPLQDSARVFDNDFVSLSVDRLTAPDGQTLSRTVLHHQGAVGILAIDEDDRVMVVDQYRHAVGRRMFELPAGILDIAGESPVAAAARELSEEADLVAERWSPLLTMYASPGCSTERWEVFVATGLSATPSQQRTIRADEEADMRQLWIDLDDLVEAALSSRIGDSMTISAVLALHALRRAGR